MLNSKKDHLSSVACFDRSELTLGARLPRKEERALAMQPADTRISAFNSDEHRPAPEVIERAMKLDEKKRARFEALREYNRVDVEKAMNRHAASLGVDHRLLFWGENTADLRQVDGSINTGTFTYTRPRLPAMTFTVPQTATAKMSLELLKAMSAAVEKNHNEALKETARQMLGQLPPLRKWFNSDFETGHTDAMQEAVDRTAALAEWRKVFPAFAGRFGNHCNDACTAFCGEGGNMDSLDAEGVKRYTDALAYALTLPEGFTPWFGDENHAMFERLDGSEEMVEVWLKDNSKFQESRIDWAYTWYWPHDGDSDDIIGYRFV